MTPIAGQPILTVAQMRAAEARVAPGENALYDLMERAGAGVADAVRRVSAGANVRILCGPGNNGGDGYVAARILRQQGIAVQVQAREPPRTPLAQRAAAAWGEALGSPGDDEEAPILVDALFGTGLSRRIARVTMIDLDLAARAARFHVAVDLPSGRDADTGLFWGDLDVVPPAPQLTLALGALKPAHIEPGAPGACGEIRVIDLGLRHRDWPVRVIGRPGPPDLTSATHKYRRGMVGVVAGRMPGAALLAATAAARTGAGYVVIFGEAPGGPASIVHRPLTREALSDERLSTVVIGPGLGRDDKARRWVDFVVALPRVGLVLDADALHLFDPAAIEQRSGPTVLTPHFGEYEAIRKRLGIPVDYDIDRITRSIRDLKAMGLGNATMVEKGFTTTIVQGDRVRIATRGSTWLSTAGTGDVLAGAIAAMLALYSNHGKSSLDAAAAGVWLHSEAARRLGPSFIADDLAAELGAARGTL